MRLRQSELPIEVAYARVIDPEAKRLVLLAYTHPVYFIPGFNKEEMDKFVNEQFIDCLNRSPVR